MTVCPTAVCPGVRLLTGYTEGGSVQAPAAPAGIAPATRTAIRDTAIREIPIGLWRERTRPRNILLATLTPLPGARFDGDIDEATPPNVPLASDVFRKVPAREAPRGPSLFRWCEG